MNKIRIRFHTWQARRALMRAFKPAKGVHLDRLARLYGVERTTRTVWVFKLRESDRVLRARTLAVARGHFDRCSVVPNA